MTKKIVQILLAVVVVFAAVGYIATRAYYSRLREKQIQELLGGASNHDSMTSPNHTQDGIQ